MRLENIVWDALDPRRLGKFWAGALGADPLTDEPDIYEARLSLDAGFFLDLCFQPVATPSPSPARLQLDVAGGVGQREVVDRLLALGAEQPDGGQEDVPWVVLTDLDGNAFRVREHRDRFDDAGPIAALPMDSSAPERDATFWAEITGWTPVDGAAPATLRHPSRTGPALEFWPEPEPKRGKNRLHLDVRRDPADDDALDRLLDSGASRIATDGQDLPWVVMADPSGNEFCVLPAPSVK